MSNEEQDDEMDELEEDEHEDRGDEVGEEEADEADEDVDQEAWGISAEDARIFNKAEAQIDSFYDEIGLLSKKKPDGPVSKFKLNFINQAIEPASRILEEDKPFPDFEKFDEADMPTASDVVAMLAQYLQAMQKFRGEFSKSSLGERVWQLIDSDERISARGPRHL